MRALIIGLCCFYLSVSLASASTPTEDMLMRIQQAQQALSDTEINIAKERQKIAKQLNTLEKNVLALREETAARRRLEDEKTLSLSQLEKRLLNWQQQQNYQQGLLQRFLQQQQIPYTTAQGVSEKITAVLSISQQLAAAFNPQWQTSELVLPNGKIQSIASISVGPMRWYWDELKGQAGIASQHDSNPGLLQSDLALYGGANDAMANLFTQGKGDIVFDPTMSRALTREQHAESLVQHVSKGGIWAIPIVMFALFAITIALLKVVQLWRLPKLVRFTPSALTLALATPASVQKLKGMQRRLLDIATTAGSVTQRDDELFVQLQDNKHALDRWIGAIAITAAVSPLLGLLGTVSGMIETFKMMTLFGSGDPEVVSGGIAQALVTTELGLVVAIPALILNAILSRRAKTYYTELESFAILISKSDDTNKDAAI